MKTMPLPVVQGKSALRRVMLSIVMPSMEHDPFGKPVFAPVKPQRMLLRITL
jgi:hypothetical protein